MDIWKISKILFRRIFGTVKEGGNLLIRKNKELCELFGEPNAITLKKPRRLHWAGHGSRMSYDDTAKLILDGNQPRLR